MSLQYIINSCSAFSINYRRIVTQALSRAGRVYTSEYPSSQPFRISVKMHDYLYYPDVRAVVQALDNLDKNNEEIINFSSVDPNLSWLTSYQGQLTSIQISGLSIASFTGNTFVITLPSGIPTGTVIFAPGDFMQPSTSRYCYKVKTQVVAPASGVTVSVLVHRPIIGSVPGATPVTVGSAVTIPVIMTVNPIANFSPMTNGAFVGWSGNFELLENIIG